MADQTTCRNCGKPFTPRHGRQIYCCSNCAKFVHITATAVSRGLDSKPTAKLRPCTGKCGKMITDYRCPECWAKIRGGRNSRFEVPEDVVTYSLGGV